MKKKTIKSYFFNFFFKNPATNYTFCFSKRGFKKNKQILKLKKSKHKKPAKQLTIYRDILFKKININQFNFIKKPLNKIFYNSFFLKKRILKYFFKNKKIHSKKILLLFFLFKKKFLYNYTVFLKQYVHIGILSSHFTHFLIQKNLTYQTWSKYNSKNFNMNSYNFNVYNHTKFLLKYTSVLLYLLYFFTRTVSLKNVFLDEKHSTNNNNTYNCITNSKKLYIKNVNSIYNFQLLLANSSIFDAFTWKDMSLLRNQCNNLSHLDLNVNLQNTINSLNLTENVNSLAIILISKNIINTTSLTNNVNIFENQYMIINRIVMFYYLYNFTK